MTASLARQIVLAARPQGKPQLTDFQGFESRSLQRRVITNRFSPRIAVRSQRPRLAGHRRKFRVICETAAGPELLREALAAPKMREGP
jgi:hypothetical protein